VQSDDSASEAHPLLLTSTHRIARSQHQEESLLLQRKIEEGSSLLRHKIEELNKNTVLLIAEAGKLIQGSKQLSNHLKSFEDRGTKRDAALSPPHGMGNR
jgi:inactivated superfamily I helicase